ncbi:MAG: DUF2585 domain-containing protein [Sphingomonadaceae bacterium]|nr:DUF2585 domain-containing protein [Sphingomonadaceae bacterium]
MGRRITTCYWIAVAAIVAVAALVLYANGRPPICPCGTVMLWQGVVESPENSQQLSDWYSFSHIIHGFPFAGLGWRILRRAPLGLSLAIATLIEAGWEVVENSPIIIDRYRAVTMAWGYSGDSIVNSVSDIAMMVAGFVFASRVPWWVSLLLGLGFEVMTGVLIREGLALNILMLLHPINAVRVWQAGA